MTRKQITGQAIFNRFSHQGRESPKKRERKVAHFRFLFSFLAGHTYEKWAKDMNKVLLFRAM